VYKNTVIHSKTIKTGPQFLLEVRMAHTLAACNLWQSTVTWQHCPKMFIMGGRGREQPIPHILLSQPPSLSVYVTSWGVTKRQCSQCHVLGLLQQLLNINKKSLNDYTMGERL
jgi:hypothetical protein